MLRWYSGDSDIPGRDIYRDDPRGPEQNRYVLNSCGDQDRPLLALRCHDETGMRLGEAKSVKEAMAIAQRHADAQRGQS